MVKLKFLLLLVAFFGVSMGNGALADEDDKANKDAVCEGFFTKERSEKSILRVKAIREGVLRELILETILLLEKSDLSQEEIEKQSLKLQAYSMLQQVSRSAPRSCYPEE